MVDTVGGELRQLPLSALRPDWRNPRFPPNAAEGFQSDIDVFAYLDKQFDAASIANSISKHGFFLSEPLIAIPFSDDDFEDQSSKLGATSGGISATQEMYIVVEGNRRLAALKGLSDPRVRAAMTDPRWKSFPQDTGLPETIPVLVAPSREHVAPILGYRHVTGIAPWDPYQQARYVASLIDAEETNLSAVEVSKLIGRDVSEVRAFYRNYSIVEQARDMFDIPDPDRIVEEFGVWTRAMTSTGIRSYIEAPAPRDVEERVYPLPDGVAERLASLTTWIFGIPRSPENIEKGRQSKDGRVIEDSRHLTRLGKVLANPLGASALEEGKSMKEAELAVLDEFVRFADSVEGARKELDTAAAVATAERARANAEALDEIDSLLESIRSAI